MSEVERLSSGLPQLSRLMGDASGLRAVVQTARRGVGMSVVQAEHDSAVLVERCVQLVTELGATLAALQLRLERDGAYTGRVVATVGNIRQLLAACERSLGDSESLEFASVIVRRASPAYIRDLSFIYHA